MNIKLTLLFVAVATVCLLPGMAMAHLGVSHGNPETGFVHDPAGLDHLLAMGLLVILAIIGVRAVISRLFKRHQPPH